MIIVDNCIISSLSKIDRLEYLENYPEIYTIHGVVEEAFESEIPSIVEALSDALDDWLDVIEVGKINRIPKLQRDYPSLSYIDCELIVSCEENEAILFTDDTKLLGIAEKDFDITTYDLCEILFSLKNEDIILLGEMEKINEDLKKKDRYKFSEKDIKRLIEEG